MTSQTPRDSVLASSLSTGRAMETFSLDVSLEQTLPAATAGNLPKISEPISVARTPRASKKKKFSRIPPWGISLIAHAALIGSMSLVSIVTIQEKFDFSLTLESEPYLSEEITLLELPVDLLGSADSQSAPAGEILPISATAVSDLSAEQALAESVTSSAIGDGGLGSITSLLGEGVGMTELVPGKGKLTVSFFGSKVEGRRIVFVLDNSGGMRGGELEMLVQELLRSVNSLTDEQEFYVIFYSDMLYPLFFPRPIQRFVPANETFKKRLASWLETVEFCMGNVVDEAIDAAASIRPDTVYLLTDGDLDQTRDQRRLNFLLDSRRRKFAIHTIGLDTGENGKAAAKLRSVAEANHGTFRAVKVTTEAKELAREQKRPYHDKEPGEVWGQAVGSGWGR
mgnify:CR=1 FL=1